MCQFARKKTQFSTRALVSVARLTVLTLFWGFLSICWQRPAWGADPTHNPIREPQGWQSNAYAHFLNRALGNASKYALIRRRFVADLTQGINNESGKPYSTLRRLLGGRRVALMHVIGSSLKGYARDASDIEVFLSRISSEPDDRLEDAYNPDKMTVTLATQFDRNGFDFDAMIFSGETDIELNTGIIPSPLSEEALLSVGHIFLPTTGPFEVIETLRGKIIKSIAKLPSYRQSQAWDVIADQIRDAFDIDPDREPERAARLLPFAQPNGKAYQGLEEVIGALNESESGPAHYWLQQRMTQAVNALNIERRNTFILPSWNQMWAIYGDGTHPVLTMHGDELYRQDQEDEEPTFDMGTTFYYQPGKIATVTQRLPNGQISYQAQDSTDAGRIHPDFARKQHHANKPAPSRHVPRLTVDISEDLLWRGLKQPLGNFRVGIDLKNDTPNPDEVWDLLNDIFPQINGQAHLEFDTIDPMHCWVVSADR